MAAPAPFTVVQPVEDFYGAPAGEGDAVFSPATLTLNDVTNLTPAASEGGGDATGQLGVLKIPINITYHGAPYHHPIGATVAFHTSSDGRTVQGLIQPKNGAVADAAAAAGGGRRTYRKRGRKSQQRRQNRKSQKSRR